MLPTIPIITFHHNQLIVVVVFFFLSQLHDKILYRPIPCYDAVKFFVGWQVRPNILKADITGQRRGMDKTHAVPIMNHVSHFHTKLTSAASPADQPWIYKVLSNLPSNCQRGVPSKSCCVKMCLFFPFTTLHTHVMHCRLIFVYVLSWVTQLVLKRCRYLYFLLIFKGLSN